MVKVEEFPEEGELVVGSVKNVKDYGAFITLSEYDGKEGFVHIADVSSGWIKYIRDHIREGQTVVCKVLRVKPSMGHIDLSLKSVNDHQRRLKIQEWKNEAKAENLLRLVGERMDKEYDACLSEFATELVREYDSLYESFFEASAGPDEFARTHDGDWLDTFMAIAQENISPPQVTIDGTLTITCPNKDGVEVIRQALIESENAIDDEEIDVDVSYIGAPRYRIILKAPDYKTAEEAIKSVAQVAIDHVLENEGQGSFARKG